MEGKGGDSPINKSASKLTMTLKTKGWLFLADRDGFAKKPWGGG